MENREIECRFLEINKEALIEKLRALGAKDEGEKLLKEIIIYDQDLKWKNAHKRMRIRNDEGTILLSYKEHTAEHTIDGTIEIELKIDDTEKALLLLEKLGYKAFRHQEKKRHTFILNEVTFDIDTWPSIPTYVELEGVSEETLKEAALAIGYDWQNVSFENPLSILENHYKIPVGSMKWFTFDRKE